MDDDPLGAPRGCAAALAIEVCAIGVGWLAWRALRSIFGW
jgi:hypothetical protein